MHSIYKILSLFLLVYLLATDTLGVPHFKVSISCRDPNLSHVFTGDTVSPKILLITASLGPLVIISLIEVLKRNVFDKETAGVIWTLYKVCFVNSFIVVLITEFIKSIIREPRPHFLHSCKPKCYEDASISAHNCTNNDLSEFHRKDLVSSFPSGHTSLSVFVGLYCSYLIYMRIPSGSKKTLLKPFFIALCLTWSLICSLSRISDKRHHWWDVLVGALLGLSFVYYVLYYLHKELPNIDARYSKSIENNNHNRINKYNFKTDNKAV